MPESCDRGEDGKRDAVTTPASVVRKKIYCFNNGGTPGMLHAVAMCEDGHVLGQHACSHEAYMRHDLGIVGTWKHENYNKHCGEGKWELEWVDKPKKHKGLQAAFTLNRHLAALADRHGSEVAG